MYESTSVVGERGQITLPKAIREKEGIRKKDRVIVRIENEKIVVEKLLGKKQKEALMVEGYKKLSKLSLEICKEWEVTEKEANRFLDDY